MERIICLIIGYAFGLIQTSYIIGKHKGIDIRDYGSGNAGTTNSMRVMGKKAGFAVVIIDIAKCIAAVVVTWLIFRNSDYSQLLKIWTSAGVILGHDYPFYMHFKGGKGIAATAGMIIAFGDPWLVLIGVIVFFIPFFTTHYVSLCSLCLSLSFLIGVIVRGNAGVYSLSAGCLRELYVFVAILTALAFIQHRANINRLVHGTEKKWGHKKDK